MRACSACRQAIARSRARGLALFVVVLATAGAADHDLVLLDRDLDGAMPRPVLGVDRIVLRGGVEPQAVPLLAVVEGALERPGGGGAPARAPAAAAARALGLLVLLGGRLVGRGVLLLRSLAGGLL